MIYKTINNSVLDIDSKTRRVKVAVSEAGIKDHDEDVIDPGAYNKSITERGPMGKNLIYHLRDHKADTQNIVGKPSEIGMDGAKLYFITDVVKTQSGNDALELYESKILNQHSIGFAIKRAEKVKDDSGDYQLIKELKLYEGSAVLWGANENTGTMWVGKSLTKEQRRINLLAQFDRLINLFSKGNVSDQTFELLEIQMIQLKDEIILLEESTQAGPEGSPAPDQEFARQLLFLTI